MLLRGATRTTAQKWLCRIARHAKRGISQICGIDEAGRGAVLGPLVVCGFSAAENLQAELKLMGVKDSKQLSRGKRDYLAELLTDKDAPYTISTVHISAQEIDLLRSQGKNLNQIESEAMARVYNNLSKSSETLIVDSFANNEARVAAEIKLQLVDETVKVVARTGADKLFPIVSAASVVAKAERDAAMAALSAECGHNLGSGYPNDPHTKKFLKQCGTDFPVWVRHSWATVSRLKRGLDGKRKPIFNSNPGSKINSMHDNHKGKEAREEDCSVFNFIIR